MGKRYACFYILGACASGLGGILAYGLMQGKGAGGLAGWSWIFIGEGIITCAVAIVGFVFLLDFPDKTGSRSLKFLTPEELQHTVARIEHDRADAHVEPFKLGRFLKPALDWQIWAFAFIFGCTTTVSYALAYFLPIILNGKMKFDVAKSQCLVAPPYAFAAIIMYLSATYSDKLKQRGAFIAANALLCIIGLAVMGFAKRPGVQYFGAFLATAGANTNVPLTLTYQANNIRGQWKRAFCSATLVGMGGVGGIVGGTVYRQQDKPGYVPGLSVSIGAQVVILGLVAVLTVYYRRMNKRQAEGKIVIAETNGFRYTY
ncbi:hypothetical protein MRB53_036976 [Persea americana]|nr:hypothetical protein MRB53_036976 [Persea americana]